MLLTTCVVALVCGFLGAFAAVKVFNDDLRGAQGATGLQGAPGEQGPAGLDGADGANGERGPRGRPGKEADAPKPPTVVAAQSDCTGQAFQMVTDVGSAQGKVKVTKNYVCFPQ